jgi:hypothetical protein
MTIITNDLITLKEAIESRNADGGHGLVRRRCGSDDS